jgi:hypothetical protein
MFPGIRLCFERRPRLRFRGRVASRPAALLCLTAWLVSFAALPPAAAQRQTPAVRARRVAPPTAAAAEADALVERAAAAACLERELDPRGSVPIDVMQARPSMPLRHPDVVEGARRAELMLPTARGLTAEVLTALAREHRVPAASLRAALSRLGEARRIRADVELRDNASVLYSDPRTIRFGTIFLAGLRSEEGVLSVLAHELVHTADGARGELSPLFRRVGQRAEGAGRTGRLSARRAEELTCDLVGVLAVRLYIERNPTDEPLARRASRAVGHNCVEHDETDSTHLSPRRTLRALLALEPAFAGQLTGDAAAPLPAAPLNHTPRRPRR